MIQPLAMDRSTRHVDVDGRLHVALNNITKANICGYAGAEIPNAASLGLDPQKVYQLFRAPEELEKAAETANNIQLLRRHIAVSADDPQKDDVVGSTGTDAAWSAPYLTNSLVIWDAAAIAGVETEAQCELSCSYRYVADMTPGEYEGKKYDGVMRDIAFNHVALVETGRAGPDVLVGDEQPKPNMEKPIMATRKSAFAQFAATAKAQADELRAKMATDASISPAVVKSFDKLAMDAAAASEKCPEGAMAGDEPLDIDDAVGGVAKDEDETAEEKAEREAKEKAAKDAAEEDDDKKEKAMDAKLKVAMDSFRDQTKAARDAERAVRPYVGDLAVAMDSADEIYKFALGHIGIKTDGIHPSAFPALLGMAPKPGTGSPRVAMDAASSTSFSKMFPDAPRVKSI